MRSFGVVLLILTPALAAAQDEDDVLPPSEDVFDGDDSTDTRDADELDDPFAGEPGVEATADAEAELDGDDILDPFDGWVPLDDPGEDPGIVPLPVRILYVGPDDLIDPFDGWSPPAPLDSELRDPFSSRRPGPQVRYDDDYLLDPFQP